MFKEKKYVVDNGYALVGKDKPLTLLTIIESHFNEYSLIFSISHVIADGRTYYEIYKMLQPGAEVRSLSPARVKTFSTAMRDVCQGAQREMDWSNSAWGGILLTFGMIGNPKTKCFAFYLDDEKVAAAKQVAAADGGVPYVTTNDILTSGFFNACQPRLGFMGFDCRGKVEGVGAGKLKNLDVSRSGDSRVVFASDSYLPSAHRRSRRELRHNHYHGLGSI